MYEYDFNLRGEVCEVTINEIMYEYDGVKNQIIIKKLIKVNGTRSTATILEVIKISPDMKNKNSYVRYT